MPVEISLLEERCLIKVSGADAESFLQNLVTHDVAQLQAGQLVYSCLLTPQGRFLHDFFIFKDAEGFFLECEKQRRDDLIRRFKIFKLRAQVIIEDCAALFDVYAATRLPEDVTGFSDPRLEALGFRVYLPENKKRSDAVSADFYRDRRISLGIPEGSPDIKPEIDMLADVNLDHLNAVSWDKGCYVGQEVTARMNYRGLAKKRMVIVSGQALAAESELFQNGHIVGEIRSVNSSGTQGLALLKLAALQDSSASIITSDEKPAPACLPEWLKLP